MKIRIFDIIATPRDIDIPDKCPGCSISFVVRSIDIPNVKNNLSLWALEELSADASIVDDSAGKKEIENFANVKKLTGFIIRVTCNACNYIIVDGIPASQEELVYLKKLLEL